MGHGRLPARPDHAVAFRHFVIITSAALAIKRTLHGGVVGRLHVSRPSDLHPHLLAILDRPALKMRSSTMMAKLVVLGVVATQGE